MTSRIPWRTVAGRTLLLASLGAYFGALRLYSVYDLGMAEWVDADIGIRAAQATRMLEGALPYRDFWALYPPFAYYLQTGLFEIFGVKLSSLRIGLACVGACSGWLAYVVTRRVASRTAAAAACALTVSWSVPSLNVNYNAWYCVPPALVALWAAVVGSERPYRWPWILAGLCAGLVLSLKATYGVFLIIGLGVAVLARRGAADRGIRGRVGATLLAIAGVGCLLLSTLYGQPSVWLLLHFGAPLGACAVWAGVAARRPEADVAAWPRLWLLTSGTAAAFLPWLLYFAWQWKLGPVLRIPFVGLAQAGAFVVLPPAQPNGRSLLLVAGLVVALVLYGRVQANHPRAAAGIAAGAACAWFIGMAVPLRNADSTERWLFTLVQSWVHIRNLVPLVAIWCALQVLWRARADPTPQRPFFAITAGATALLLTYYPYSDVNHMQWAWPAQTVLICVLVDRWVAQRGAPARAWWLLPFGLAAVQWFALATHFVRPDPADSVWRLRRFQYAATPRGDVLVPEANARVVGGAVQYIRDTTADDAPVLELYGQCLAFLADRPNPTTIDYFWPGLLDEATERVAVADLEARPPAYVIGHRRNAKDEPLARFADYFPVLGKYVADRYRPQRQIGPYVFYVRRAPGPS